MTLMMRPRRAGADGNGDRGAGVAHRLAAHQTVGNVHGDAAHRILAEMLGDFENEALAVIGGFQRVQNFRQVAFELDVDDGADDLGDMACGAGFSHFSSSHSVNGQSASAPEMISISSLVIIA